jgi:hypothetical protein
LNNLAYRETAVVDRLTKKVLAWQTTLPKGRFDPSAGKSEYPWPKSGERQ